MANKKKLLSTNDFVTKHGKLSKTFKPPPLDGTLCLAQMIDWHGANSSDHTWATFMGPAGLKLVTWKMLQQAAHRVAKLILDEVKSDSLKGRTIAVLANRDQLTYIALLAGILRAGACAFLISPRNAVAGVVHLLEATNTDMIIGSNDYNEQSLINGALEKLPRRLNVIRAPVFSDIFSFIQDGRFEYLTPMESPSDNDVTSIIIHSSGSTAFPKPIPLSHLGVLQWARIPCYGYHDMCGERVGIQSAPPFHGMGFYHALAVPCTSGCEIAVFPPQEPPLMPTPNRVLASFQETSISIATGPPTNLVQWVNDESAIKYLSTLKWVRVGGGPCPKAVGDSLVDNGVNLLNGWGTTEVGVLSNPCPKEPYRADWQYIECTRNCNPIFKRVDGDGEFYEICFPITPTHIPSVFTDKENHIYETNDLVQLHPTKSNFFKVVGRVDDQIMLSTGEKTNPGPMEIIIRGDRMIKQAIYFGRGRFQNGVLVEPSPGFEINVNDSFSVAKYRNEIWPSIQKANEISPAHSRIYKEMILIASSSKPFLLTPKGSVARPRTLDLYNDEIEEIYRLAETSDATEETVPLPDKESLTTETLFNYTATVVKEVMRQNGEEINLDLDLFEQGCDSLQATFIRNRVSASLKKAKLLTHNIPQNWVYSHPTISELAQNILTMIQGSSTSTTDKKDSIPLKLESVAKEYSQGFPVHSGTFASPSKRCILITGTTGTLGCYLLNEFNKDPTVDKIYAVNRPSKGSRLLVRQKEALDDRGIDSNILDNFHKIILVEADLSCVDFAIPSSLYKDMQRSVTTIIHNAWRLDFNLGLNSFTPNIKGVRNLVDFALGSPFKIPPIIINTSSVGTISSDPNGWVAEEPAKAEYVAPTGYGQSKFISERILQAARNDANLPTINVRIGQLCGSQINGAWNSSDWFPMIVKSHEETGCLPQGSAPVAWIPVDKAAEVINDFSNSAKQEQTLHLVHPHTVMWNDVISCIAKTFQVKLVTPAEWLKALVKADDISKNPALKLLPFYQLKASTMEQHSDSGSHEAFGLPRLQTNKSEQHSRALADLDEIGDTDVLKWLEYWTKQKFLISKDSSHV